METSVFERHKVSFLENLDTLQVQVERIDKTLRLVDQFMDVFQPPASGKLRVLFVQNNNETVPELRVMYRKRGGFGWHTKRVTKGWGSRSLKRSGDFEKNYSTVKSLCIGAESLLSERSRLMVRLRSLTSGFREAVKSSSKKMDKIEALHVEPYRQLFADILDTEDQDH